METADILILYCEISVALAGFAGIAGAVAQTKERLSKIRVQTVVTCAIPLLLFSFASLLMLAADSSDELVWRSTSLAMLIFIVGYYVTHIEDIKTLFVASPIEKVVIAMDMVVAAALLLNVLVLHSWNLSTIYLTCLFSWLVQACYFFYVSIESLWRETG